MNVTPAEVVRPATPRAWAAALLDGVDKNGKLKRGIAIDAAPFALFSRDMSLFEYTQLSAAEKMLMNTNVSFGTAKGNESDDKSLKLGLGLHVRLYDLGDPRDDAELTKCYRDIVNANRPSDDDFFKPAGVKAGGFKDCLAKRKSARWNASSGILGLGQAWTSDTGEVSDRKRSTGGAWLSLGYGFENFDGMPALHDNSQVLVHYKMLSKERVADPLNEGKFVDQKNRLAAVQMRMGVQTFAGMLEASWQRLSVADRPEEKVRRYAVGLEFRIASNTWLVFSTGGERGRTTGENGSFVLTTIRYGQQPTTFGPQ
jgi:hypothetical protein